MDNSCRTYKKEDSYHFSLPFEYIKKNLGNDNYDMASSVMDIDVIWDDLSDGYVIRIDCSEKDSIAPEEGNGSLEEYYEEVVYGQLVQLLGEKGVPAEALAFGGML